MRTNRTSNSVQNEEGDEEEGANKVKCLDELHEGLLVWVRRVADKDEAQNGANACRGHVEPKDPAVVCHGERATDDGPQHGAGCKGDLEGALGEADLAIGSKHAELKG